MNKKEFVMAESNFVMDKKELVMDKTNFVMDKKEFVMAGVGHRSTEIINREFKKLRRRRRGERRLKNKFIFYLRISRHSEVIYFVYHCQNYHETESRTQR